MSSLFQQAAEYAFLAIEADKQGKYQEAIANYQQALDRLIPTLQQETDPARRQQLQQRANAYMERAEKLNKFLRKHNQDQGRADQGRTLGLPEPPAQLPATGAAHAINDELSAAVASARRAIALGNYSTGLTQYQLARKSSRDRDQQWLVEEMRAVKNVHDILDQFSRPPDLLPARSRGGLDTPPDDNAMCFDIDVGRPMRAPPPRVARAAPASQPRSSAAPPTAGQAAPRSRSGQQYDRPWRREPQRAPAKPERQAHGQQAAPAQRTQQDKEPEYQPKSERAREASEKGEPVFQPAPGDGEYAQAVEANMLDRHPNVRWVDIAGLEQAKNLLEEAVVLPMVLPLCFKGIRRPWRGVLLFGPPGTGKTMLAKAVATESKMTFFNVSTASVASKWRGDSERIVKVVFQMARFYAPSVVFFDEFDAIASTRSGKEVNESSQRILSELLQQIDGLETSGGQADPNSDEVKDPPQVVVLAATNYPWNIDSAMIRRLEKRIYIPLPEPQAVRSLLDINMRELTLNDDVNVDELVNMLNGYNGADITSICRDAAMAPIRKAITGLSKSQIGSISQEEIARAPISMDDFRKAIQAIHPSVNEEDIQKYIDWERDKGAQ